MRTLPDLIPHLSGLLPHSAYSCPRCGAGLLNITSILDRGIRKVCIGPVRHYWHTPPVEEMYPGTPTARQRYVMDCVKWMEHELFMLPKAVMAWEREARLNAIEMWADMIIEATREEWA